MSVDCQSHILPGIDDGSASVQQSIEMLRMEAKQGITRVLATPHFYANIDTPEQFLARRNRAERLLREEMAKCSGLPEVAIGAEVYFFRGISESESLLDLTIAGKKFILLEMMGVPWSNSMYSELERIYLRYGVVPVIAHIDRYIRPFHTLDILERLSELPVLIQANASFFLNRFTKSFALKMLQREQIHLLGSDCHNLTDRAPNLELAHQVILRQLGDEALHFVDQTAVRILDSAFAGIE